MTHFSRERERVKQLHEERGFLEFLRNSDKQNCCSVPISSQLLTDTFKTCHISRKVKEDAKLTEGNKLADSASCEKSKIYVVCELKLETSV